MSTAWQCQVFFIQVSMQEVPLELGRCFEVLPPAILVLHFRQAAGHILHIVFADAFPSVNLCHGDQTLGESPRAYRQQVTGLTCFHRPGISRSERSTKSLICAAGIILDLSCSVISGSCPCHGSWRSVALDDICPLILRTIILYGDGTCSRRLERGAVGVVGPPSPAGGGRVHRVGTG